MKTTRNRVILTEESEVPESIKEVVDAATSRFNIDKYGFGEWLYKNIRWELSDDNQYPLIVKPTWPDSDRYDCTDCANTINKELKGKNLGLEGFVSSTAAAPDCLGLFNEHHYNILKWNKDGKEILLVVDGVPFIKTYGANHPINSVMSFNSEEKECSVGFNDTPILSASQFGPILNFSGIGINYPRMQSKIPIEGQNILGIQTFYETEKINLIYTLTRAYYPTVEMFILSLDVDYQLYTKQFENPNIKNIDIRGDEFFNTLLDMKIVKEKEHLSKGLIIKDPSYFSEIYKLNSVAQMGINQHFINDKKHIGNYLKALLMNFQISNKS